MVKTLYMIGGTMGVGKTTVCQQVKQDLPNSVFLDGDWCWDASPFQVTDETKAMVTNNICYLLNNLSHRVFSSATSETHFTSQFCVSSFSSMESMIDCWCITQQKITFS